MENALNISFGKMSTEHSQAIKGLTLEPCLKKSQKPKFQCLDLASGQMPEWSEGVSVTLHGVSWTPNIGECPSAERESTLWEIIETDVPLKYYLSQKACSGILRRAARRGKELPKPLKDALERQAETSIDDILKNAIPIDSLQENMIGRQNKHDTKGSGIHEGFHTLTATNAHTICYPIMLEYHPHDSRIKIDNSGNCQTLTNRMGTGGGNVPLCMIPIQIIRDQYMFVPIAAEDISYIVRRLTPRECAKLQGFPADWHEGITNAKGKTLPDSAAYKGYGNAVATVCAEYPIAGIVEICNTIY